MKHDAWMNDILVGTQLTLEPLGPLSQCTHAFVLCDLCNDGTCENVACDRCVCVHPPSIRQGTQIFGKRKSISELKKTRLFSPG